MTLVLFVGFIVIWNLDGLLSLLFVPIKLRRSEQNIFTLLMNALGFWGTVFSGVSEICRVLYLYTQHICVLINLSCILTFT